MNLNRVNTLLKLNKYKSKIEDLIIGGIVTPEVTLALLVAPILLPQF